jgi:hypothetical protein
VKEFRGAAAGTVKTDPSAAHALLSDIERYPSWYPEVVRRVELVRHAEPGQPARAQTTLHAALGPLNRDFSFLLEIITQPELVRLRRIPQEPSDPEELELTWRVTGIGETALAVEITARLDVPRLLPLQGAGDTVARGFLAAARRTLEAGR